MNADLLKRLVRAITDGSRDDLNRLAHSGKLRASATNLATAWQTRLQQREQDHLPAITGGAPLLLEVDPGLEVDHLPRLSHHHRDSVRLAPLMGPSAQRFRPGLEAGWRENRRNAPFRASFTRLLGVRLPPSAGWLKPLGEKPRQRGSQHGGLR